MRRKIHKTNSSPTPGAGLHTCVLLCILAGSLLAWVPGWSEPSIQPKFLVAVIGSLFLLLLPAGPHLHPTRLGRILPAASCGLILLGCTSAWVNGVPAVQALIGFYGRNDALLLLLASVILVITTARLPVKRIPQITGGLLVLGAAAVLVAMVQHYTGLLMPQEWTKPGIIATFGNSNFAAAFFAMLGVLSLGLAADGTYSRRTRLLFLLLLISSAAACVWTESDQGPLALAIGGAAVGVLRLWTLPTPRPFRTRSLAVIILLIGAGIAASIALKIGPVSDRFWAVPTIEIRVQYWAAALRMIADNPLWGVGPDNFAGAVSRYRDLDYIQLLGPTLKVSAAHNVPLQIASTLGIPALLLWLLLLTSGPAVLLMRLLRNRVEPELIPQSAALLGLFCAYLAQAMISINHISLVVTACVAAGLTHALSRSLWREDAAGISPPRFELMQSRRIRILAGSAMACAAVLILLLDSRVIATANQAAKILQTRNTTRELTRSLIASPYLPCSLRGQLMTALVLQDSARATDEAIDQAMRSDPHCSRVVYMRAWFSAKNKGQEARRDIERFLQYDPLNYEVWQLQADWAAEINDRGLALQSIEKAVSLARITPGDRARSVAFTLARQFEQLKPGE